MKPDNRLSTITAFIRRQQSTSHLATLSPRRRKAQAGRVAGLPAVRLPDRATSEARKSKVVVIEECKLEK